MLDRYDSILIGGSGFVGTQLGAYLARTGERVLNVSRRPPAEPVAGVDFVPIDFENQEAVASFTLPHADSIIILIGQIGSGFDPESDRRALRTIIDLVNAQTELMKVLYSSTTLVYGNSDTPAEESDPLQAIEPYAKHKAENEDFLKKHLSSRHHLGILRMSNIFGDTRSRGFVSLIMNRLLVSSTEKFRVNGDGNQERDYIYIDDLAEAIASVKARLVGNDTVNIATGESRTLVSVLGTVQSVCSEKLAFEVTHEPVLEATRIRVSNMRLREKYGYVPRHTFAEGVALMWKHSRAIKMNHPS